MSPKMGKTPRGSGEQVREKIEALERRLTALEAHLQRLRSQARQSTGSAKEQLTRLEKQVGVRSLGRISQVLAASRRRVEQDTERLSRALRAGMKAGTRAYRRTRKV